MPFTYPPYALSILISILVLGYIICDPFAAAFLPLSERDVTLNSASKGFTPNLPYHGDGNELPAPASDLTLQHIVIGRGIQNYSCVSPKSVPVALGALATLFDITTLANLVPGAAIDSLTVAVELALPRRSWKTDDAAPHLAFGNHYFDAAGNPTFNLSSIGKSFVGRKAAGVKAPMHAHKGPAGTGAVDWLQLKDKGGSIGISETYRVVTVGGNPRATCSTTGVMKIPYVAEYWFYN